MGRVGESLSRYLPETSFISHRKNILENETNMEETSIGGEERREEEREKERETERQRDS